MRGRQKPQSVGPEDDLHARPLAAQRVHQQLEHRARPADRVPVVRLQHRRKQVPPVEHVQRQVAVGPVVPVPVAPLLHPVQGDVGGVEVQHDAFRRHGMGGHELIEQHSVQRQRL